MATTSREVPGRAVIPEGGDRTDAERTLREMPPSARTVYEVLQTQGPLTHKALVDEAGIPGRTVRYAVRRLRDAGLLGARCNLMDCRQCFFFVQDVCEGKPEFRKTRGS